MLSFFRYSPRAIVSLRGEKTQQNKSKTEEAPFAVTHTTADNLATQPRLNVQMYIYTHTHTHTISLLRLSGGLKISLSLSLLSNQSSSGDECTTSVVRTHFRGIHPQTLLIITCMYTHNTRRGYPAHVSDRMTTVCVCVYVPQY